MKKYVLTGGPNPGKSTTIEDLKKRGFSVLEEIAREMIQKHRGFPKEKSEMKSFQEMMFDEQLKRESKLDREIVFLDRGIGDYQAYAEHLFGYVPPKLKNLDFAGRYNKIFFLDRLPFVHDGLRVESGDEEAQKIHDLIADSYKKAGYDITFVPVLPIKERTEYILEKIK
jgi:predicted ATPase